MDRSVKKFRDLTELIRSSGSMLAAFSGGVDSALLAYAAFQALGERVLAVTVVSPLSPAGEAERAKAVACRIGIRHRFLEVSVLDDPFVAANSPERCYYCKKFLFTSLRKLAAEEGLAAVADGENADDAAARRPGTRAVKELGVRSPLQEAGLTKAEIRELSRRFNLPTWNAPSQACLATRFPYGTPLEPGALRRVDQAEAALRELGLEQVRLRQHGDIARIEIKPLDLEAIKNKRDTIVEILKDRGYRYICLDLEGYRFGSMDEVLL